MTKKIIGLKLADSTFYPILTRGTPVKKHLQVTTASDNQTTVQINLFSASDETFTDAEYVDTLMIEGLVPHEQKLPALDLTLTLDENDVLTADLVDTESGESTNSSVSLVTLGEDALDDFPNYDILRQKDSLKIDDIDLNFNLDDSFFYDDIKQPDSETSSFNSNESSAVGSGITNFDFLDVKASRKKIPLIPLLCVLCALISIASCFIAWLMILDNKQKIPELITDAAPVVRYETVSVLSDLPDYPQRLEAAAAREDTIVVIDAPVVVPASVKKVYAESDGTKYKVKWGDTLWDIADTFYKNPWMYDNIARANNIKNPDFILSGTWIIIPPK